MKNDIELARERTKAAVRLVTLRYAIAANRMIDFLVTVPNDKDRASTVAISCAWRQISEFFSFGFALSERDDLRGAWLAAAVGEDLFGAVLVARQHVNGWKQKKPFNLHALHYFAEAAQDFHTISSVPLRAVPDENPDWSGSPDGFDAFVESQIEAGTKMERAKRLAFDSSPIGELCSFLTTTIVEPK